VSDREVCEQFKRLCDPCEECRTAVDLVAVKDREIAALKAEIAEAGGLIEDLTAVLDEFDAVRWDDISPPCNYNEIKDNAEAWLEKTAPDDGLLYRCRVCRRVTTYFEAHFRKFNTDRCAECGGDLIPFQFVKEAKGAL
jgi:hypothetical protein